MFGLIEIECVPRPSGAARYWAALKRERPFALSETFDFISRVLRLQIRLIEGETQRNERAVDAALWALSRHGVRQVVLPPEVPMDTEASSAEVGTEGSYMALRGLFAPGRLQSFGLARVTPYPLYRRLAVRLALRFGPGVWDATRTDKAAWQVRMDGKEDSANRVVGEASGQGATVSSGTFGGRQRFPDGVALMARRFTPELAYAAEALCGYARHLYISVPRGAGAFCRDLQRHYGVSVLQGPSMSQMRASNVFLLFDEGHDREIPARDGAAVILLSGGRVQTERTARVVDGARLEVPEAFASVWPAGVHTEALLGALVGEGRLSPEEIDIV